MYAEVGDDLAGERERHPDRVGMPEPVEDVAESGRPGDGERRPERERDAERDEEAELPGCMVEMALRPQPATGQT